MNAVSHWFTYRGESSRVGRALALVADARTASGDLLRAELRQPRMTGLNLTALHRVVSTRFFDPAGMRIAAPVGNWSFSIDPIVTSDSDVARFEGFSPCCGVWARYDLGFEALDVAEARRGTTNVDFGSALRAAAASLISEPEAAIVVGPDAVHLDVAGSRVTERQIDLPKRWLRGLVEVQIAQAAMTPWMTLSRAQMVALTQALPRTATREPVHLTRSGAGFAVRARATPGSLPLHDARRLLVAEPLIMTCSEVRVFQHASGASAWVLVMGDHRFTLCLSPSADRGFSGEGFALDLDLDADPWTDLAVLDRLAAGERSIDAADALARLGTQGLVGLDLGERRWYHRALPYQVDADVGTPPRWRRGQALAAAGAVRPGPDGTWHVAGTEVTHTVRLDTAGDRCTCTWHARHGGARGPCAHIVAARRMAA
jgi:hypothetical protein